MKKTNEKLVFNTKPQYTDYELMLLNTDTSKLKYSDLVMRAKLMNPKLKDLPITPPEDDDCPELIEQIKYIVELQKKYLNNEPLDSE